MEAFCQRIAVVVVACFLVLGGSGCGKSGEVVEARDTDGGGFRVSYRIGRDGFPLNQHCSLIVQVAPIPEYTSLEDIQIEVDADMPSHGHGINTLPRVSETSPGVYEVDGLLFHMPGEWELYIDVVDGAVRERATFPFILK